MCWFFCWFCGKNSTCGTPSLQMSVRGGGCGVVRAGPGVAGQTQRRLIQRSPGSPPPSSIGFIWTECDSPAHDNLSATISPPPPLFMGWRNLFFYDDFLLVHCWHKHIEIIKKCVKDTLIWQYSYKIELEDNRNLNTPPPTSRHMQERFLSLEPDFADNMRATATLNLSASNWVGSGGCVGFFVLVFFGETSCSAVHCNITDYLFTILKV